MQPPTTSTQSTVPPVTTAPKSADMMDIGEEDSEMALAIRMSMTNPTQTSSDKPVDEINQVMEDPNFVNSVLMSLPGVDPNDERIKVLKLASFFET